MDATQDCSPVSGCATKNERWGRGACSLELTSAIPATLETRKRVKADLR